MLDVVKIEPIDYLIIGHITRDLLPSGAGSTLGGTATYSALTAQAAGMRVGVVTSHAEVSEPYELRSIQVITATSEKTTTFENIQTPTGRVQRLHYRARDLDISMVPETWRTAPIVHLGPVAQEVDPKLVRAFPNALIGLTLQGWLREWNQQGEVRFTEWPEASFVLQQASAAVLSIEDVAGDERIIDELATSIRILVVTEGAKGARLYWNGDVRKFRAPTVKEVDPTGAGDVFAAAFFIRLYQTRDPWEAARFATQLASISVTRPGISGIPTPSEVKANLIEVLP